MNKVVQVFMVIALTNVTSDMHCAQKAPKQNLVKLKDGWQVHRQYVIPVMANLENLKKKDFIEFVEIVEKARKPDHKMSVDQKAKKLLLIEEDGLIHDDIRHIILSAVSGEDFDLVISNPVAKEGSRL